MTETPVLWNGPVDKDGRPAKIESGVIHPQQPPHRTIESFPLQGQFFDDRLEIRAVETGELLYRGTDLFDATAKCQEFFNRRTAKPQT